MQTNNEQPARLTYRINEVAALLGVTTRTIERWIAGGTLKASKVQRAVLIQAADVRALTQSSE